MSVKDRIKTYANSQNIKIAEFEKAISAANGYVNSISKSVGRDKLELILEKFPNINPEWLITGQGSMLREAVKKEVRVKEMVGIPLIPVSAMAGMFTIDKQVLELECERYIIPSFAGADFLIQVKGDSMVPKYYSGDIIACKRLVLDTFFQWNKVYVLDTDQGPIIKKIHKGSAEDSLLIISENENYPPFELHKRQIYNIALVIGLIRVE